MIVVLKPDIDKAGNEYGRLIAYLNALPNIRHRVHDEVGTLQTLTEIYLIGETLSLDQKELEAFEVSMRRILAWARGLWRSAP